MKLPTAKLRRGSSDVCPPPGAARKIEDYYVFPMDSGFCAVGQSRTPTAMVAANWRAQSALSGLNIRLASALA
jgi:hypothetical protein